MNKTELVEVVSSKAEITKAEAQKVVTVTLDAIIEGLVSDGKVILPGFGSFETRQRTARTGRNPRTGEKIKIKATKAPAFKAGKGMKDAVAKKKFPFPGISTDKPRYSSEDVLYSVSLPRYTFRKPAGP